MKGLAPGLVLKKSSKVIRKLPLTTLFLDLKGRRVSSHQSSSMRSFLVLDIHDDAYLLVTSLIAFSRNVKQSQAVIKKVLSLKGTPIDTLRSPCKEA